MSEGVVVHAEAVFEAKRHENEIHKMAEFYLIFKPHLENYLALTKCTHKEKTSFERNCKGVFDRVVKKMVQDGKSPYRDNFPEFLESFKMTIIQNSAFTSSMSLDIVQLVKFAHESM